MGNGSKALESLKQAPGKSVSHRQSEAVSPRLRRRSDALLWAVLRRCTICYALVIHKARQHPGSMRLSDALPPVVTPTHDPNQHTLCLASALERTLQVSHTRLWQYVARMAQGHGNTVVGGSPCSESLTLPDEGTSDMWVLSLPRCHRARNSVLTTQAKYIKV
jgi:hypothetical protein